MKKIIFFLIVLSSFITTGETETYYYVLNKINLNNTQLSEKTILSWTNIPGTQLNTVFLDGDKTNFIYTVYFSSQLPTELEKAVIYWGDETSEKKKELAKFTPPWCGTTDGYFSQTVVAKKVSSGQVLINNEAKLSAMISNGQVSEIKFKNNAATLMRVFCTYNDKSLFVVNGNDYSPIFYLEELRPNKVTELSSVIRMPENYKPYVGIPLNDSLYVLSDASCNLYKLTGSSFIKVSTIGNLMPKAFIKNKLYYTYQNALYKRNFESSANSFDSEKKIMDIGYFTSLSNDGNYMPFLINDSIYVFSFLKDTLVYKSYVKNAAKIRAIYMDSTFLYLERLVDVVNVYNAPLPQNFFLSQNYPNPFNPETTISYKLQAAGNVSLKVYDVLGREVATLVDEYKQAGTYNCQWRIENGELPSGVYFYQLCAGNFVETKKLVLMK